MVGLGHFGGWTPASLGSTLVWAVDTNDSTMCPDDGSGQAPWLAHMYDNSLRVTQPLFGNRPLIASNNGNDGKRRVITLGADRFLKGNGGHIALRDMFNGTLTTTSGTMVMAVKLSANASFWAEPWLWINSSADKWLHLHIRNTDNWFRVRDTAVDYNAAYTSGLSGWFFISCVKAGTSLSMRVNGVTQASGTYSGPANTFTAADFLINASQDSSGVVISNSSGDTFTQAVSGIIACNTALSGSALIEAETWVRRTAGL